MLYINRKIPLTCCINCAGGITGHALASYIKWDTDAPVEIQRKLRSATTGYGSVSLDKHNAQLCSTEVLRKLRGWHARKEACPRTTRWREVRPLRYRERPEDYINRRKFWPHRMKKDREFLQKNRTVAYVYVHFNYLWPSLTLPIRNFWVIKKKSGWLNFHTLALSFFFAVYNSNIYQ